MLEAYINEIYFEDVKNSYVGVCEGRLKEMDGNKLEVKKMYIFNLPNKYDFNGKIFYIVNVLRLLSGGSSRSYAPAVGEIYTNCYLGNIGKSELCEYNGDRAIRIDNALICYERKVRGYGKVEQFNTFDDLIKVMEDHLKITRICDDCGTEYLLNNTDLPEKNCGFCVECLKKEDNIKLMEQRAEEWKALEEKRKKFMEAYTKPYLEGCLPVYENGERIDNK